MKKSLLILSPWGKFWYAKKGGTPVVYEFIKGCINAGYEVHMVCPQENEDVYLDGFFKHGFKNIFGKFNPRLRISRQFLSKLEFFWYVISYIYYGFRVSRRIHPCVIYGFAGSGSVSASILGTFLRVPNVSRHFGTFLFPHLYNPLSILLRFDEALGYIMPCRYIVITDDGTRGKEVANYFGVPEKKIKFWMNGIDDLFAPNFDKAQFKKSIGIPPEKKIILALSRLDTWKRVDRLVSAAPSVLSLLNDVVFLIVGDGPERSNLEKMVGELNISANVHFCGAVPHEEVAKYFNCADIFVSLYDLSNIGNPLLEAMMCQNCIVTLNTGSTGDIICNEYNGIIFDIDSISQLPDYLIRLLNDETLRVRLGKNARTYALKHFITWNKRVQYEIELINSIIDSH